jgi:phage gp36-like protein
LSYISTSDLDEYLSPKALRQLTDDDGEGVRQEAIVTECIVGAEAEVNSILSKRYTVPLTGTIPAIVTEASVVGTVYRLHARRMRIPTDVKEMYERSLKTLEKIAEGDQDLDVAVTETGGQDIEVSFNERIHNRTEWQGW